MFNKVQEFVVKHKDISIILGLLVACYFLFFYQMGNYKLIDVDETRYVTIARDMFLNKDFMTLRLNSEYFFEKPPLYFWLEILSFSIFGKVNEFTARFPMALVATFACFLVYFIGQKLVSKNFGFMSALIAITSFEFLILSRITILDLLLSVCIMASAYFGLLTLFSTFENKKNLWYLFYMFSALAVLTKGLPGVILPVAIVFGAYLLFGRIKEVFKLDYFPLGVAIFLVISLPWHIVMLKTYNPQFFNDYVVTHHLARFFAKEELGRKEPFYYFIPVFLVCFIPWIFSFLAAIVEAIVKKGKGLLEYLKSFKIVKFFEDVNNLNDEKKFLFLNIWMFAVIFLFFSSATTKLPTYILPCVFPAAFITAYFWSKYIDNGEYKKSISVSVIIFNSILVIAAIVACFAFYFLKPELYSQIAGVQPHAIFLFVVLGIVGLASLIGDSRKVLFASYVIFMINLIVLSTNYIFPMMTKFGQDELVKYATKARFDGKKLMTFGVGRKYSLLYTYGDVVALQPEKDYKWLKEYIKENPDAYMIIKTKEMEEIKKDANFGFLDVGKKYMLVTYVKVR